MPDGRYTQAMTLYDNAEWATGVVSDYDVSAQTLFVNCLAPKYVSIRTDAAITIKFNSTSNHSITVAANTEFAIDFQFQALYITAVSSANVKVLFMQ